MVDPLEGLRPLHMPPPVSWWPPAPGWWLLALLVPALVVGLVWLYRRGAPRRAALARLRGIEKAGLGPVETVAAIGVLLKAYALGRFPAAEVAALSGSAWLRFLDEHGGGGRFCDGPGRVLLDGPYRREVEADLGALFGLARYWIKQCRRWRR